MLRWGLIFFGLFLLIGGIGAINDYEPAEEGGNMVTVNEARELVSGGARQFITMQAEIDQSVRLYSTGLAKPKYAGIRPDEIHTLDAESPASQLTALNGCAVEVESFLNPLSVLKIQSITYQEGEQVEDGTINSERFVAPLLSFDNRLFVCSGAFNPGSPQGEEFKTQTHFTGSVSTAELTTMAENRWMSTIRVEGYEPSEDESMNPDFNFVGPDYFATMGTPILRGREFTAADVAGAHKVAIINQTMAKYFFENEDPIGRRFGFDSRAKELDIKIIGVVSDGKYSSLKEEPLRYAYIPYMQDDPLSTMTFYVRAAYDELVLVDSVREAGRAVPL